MKTSITRRTLLRQTAGALVLGLGIPRIGASAMRAAMR
jgi:hypothetical protein